MPQLELAHVLFMDVVGYSLLPMEHQREIIYHLQEIVHGAPEYAHAQKSNSLISQPTGDGMALAFFGDPTQPLCCARYLAKLLRDPPRLKLRMGIHTGPVYRLADINANLNVAGGGMNLAQRVMDCGDAGHILLSRTMAETIAQLSTWRELLHDLGEVEVKHGIRIQIFNAYSDEFGNAEIPSKLRARAGLPDANNRTAASADRSETSPSLPFDPWKPVVPPAFVGRAGVLARLQVALEEGRSVSLVGDWRIGKSSLLKTYFPRLQSSGRPAKLLNGSDREGSSPAEFVEIAIGKEVENTPDLAADALSAWARQHHQPGLQPTLVVDEFDKLITRFDHRFFERLRGMLDYLCVIVSSRRELDRLYQELGRTSPFHNRLELCWVGLLEQRAAEELINRCNAASGQNTRQLVWEWAGRHPFFIQLFGRKLTDSIKFGESVEEATEQFLTESASRLRELWATLQARDRDILRKSIHTPQIRALSLRRRGLLAEEGRPFGRVLVEWLQEENL